MKPYKLSGDAALVSVQFNGQELKLCKSEFEPYMQTDSKAVSPAISKMEEIGLTAEDRVDISNLVRKLDDLKMSFEEYGLLANPDLFDLITEDELDKKIVGELETRKTIFLCACGALVENSNLASYNLLVNSESGAGKDWITGKSLEVFPHD